MNAPVVRYECSINIFTLPFEVGLRHLKLAFCDGSQETLLSMAKERILHRPCKNDHFEPLTKSRRFSHIVLGFFETAGYLTLFVPFVIAAVDRFFNRPWYCKGGYAFRTHMEEGGDFHESHKTWRKNPFDPNGAADPFYQNASWIKNSHVS